MVFTSWPGKSSLWLCAERRRPNIQKSVLKSGIKIKKPALIPSTYVIHADVAPCFRYQFQEPKVTNHLALEISASFMASVFCVDFWTTCHRPNSNIHTYTHTYTLTLMVKFVPINDFGALRRCPPTSRSTCMSGSRSRSSASRRRVVPRAMRPGREAGGPGLRPRDAARSVWTRLDGAWRQSRRRWRRRPWCSRPRFRVVRRWTSPRPASVQLSACTAVKHPIPPATILARTGDYAPISIVRGIIKWWPVSVCLSVCLSVCVPRLNSRTERPRKPTIGKMEAHQTGNQWTYLEVKVKGQGHKAD